MKKHTIRKVVVVALCLCLGFFLITNREVYAFTEVCKMLLRYDLSANPADVTYETIWEEPRGIHGDGAFLRCFTPTEELAAQMETWSSGRFPPEAQSIVRYLRDAVELQETSAFTWKFVDRTSPPMANHCTNGGLVFYVPSQGLAYWYETDS